MPWFKVDDRFWSHPKTAGLSDAATALWLRAGSWSSGHLTDGRIPVSMLRFFRARRRSADELVDAGLWSDVGDAFVFHAWDEYQPSKSQVEAKREATRNRVNAWRERHGNAVTNTSDDEDRNAAPDPTRPDPTNKEVPKGTSKRTPEKPLPETWEPNENHASYAMENRLDLAHEAGQFRAHAAANDRRQRNWDMAFRTWLGNAAKWSSDRKPNAPAGRRVPSNEEWMYR